MTPEQEVLRMLEANTLALNRHSDLLEQVLGKRGLVRRMAQSDWLGAADALQLLRPYIVEKQCLKVLRDAGHLGEAGEGFRLIGRAYEYEPRTVEALRRKFESGKIAPIRRRNHATI